MLSLVGLFPLLCPRKAVAGQDGYRHQLGNDQNNLGNMKAGERWEVSGPSCGFLF